MASIRFLGAAGTVTGSKYLLEAAGRRLLIDAGLFQGQKPLRQRNREPLPVSPRDLDAIVLTHAHIDHTGYLPVIVRDGFRGRVHTTRATRDLAGLMLPDSGRLQEEEAESANRNGYSKHAPALPLYTEEDARRALPHLEGIEYHAARELWPGLSVTFRPAGHILGSATVQVDVDEPGRPRQRVLFSGDLGRYDMPVIPDPEPVPDATTLLVECTYGDRTHGAVSPKDALAEAVSDAARKGGAIIIPSFAIGRAQDILYYLRELEDEGRIPVLDVFVDSPMATDATPIYARHAEEHDEAMRALLQAGTRPFATRRLEFTRTRDQSKRINQVRQCIIISASGMVTGGRVLHHLAQRLPHAENTVLLVGYQAAGTRGRLLQDGASEVKMLGRVIPVKAQVRTVSGFSAHADHEEVMRWLGGFTTPPRRVFCVHGEDAGLEAMRKLLVARGLDAYVPKHLEQVELV